MLFTSVLLTSFRICSAHLFGSVLLTFVRFCSAHFCSVLFCSLLFFSALVCTVYAILFCSHMLCPVLLCWNSPSIHCFCQRDWPPADTGNLLLLLWFIFILFSCCAMLFLQFSLISFVWTFSTLKSIKSCVNLNAFSFSCYTKWTKTVKIFHLIGVL